MADFEINVNAFVNQPPSSVGDGSTTIDYGETIIFTRAMLTSMLSPAYSDPEGDPAYKLKILTVPATGELKLDGATVINGQEILFTDIDLGLFTYVPDNTNTSTYVAPFSFEISDTGSQTFVG